VKKKRTITKKSKISRSPWLTRGKPFYANLERLRAMPMSPDSTPAIRAERDSGF